MVSSSLPSFLPKNVAQLTEATSIALAQSVQQIAIDTPISHTPILTTYVHQGLGNVPLLLIHGFDSSILEFRRLFPLLAAESETWALDLLGFGFTDRPADVTFDPLAIKTHLYCTWKTLINRPAILVGASMGGTVAIDFTLTYPEAVKKLVLIDSAGFAMGPAIGKYLIPPLGYLAAEFLRKPQVRQKVSLKAYVDPSFVSPDALLCAGLHLNCPNWQRAMIAFTRSGGYTFLPSQMAQIEQPTLILWGDSDKILGTADAEKFRQTIPNSQLFWVQHCGHVPHLEKPQITAQHILEFVRN